MNKFLFFAFVLTSTGISAQWTSNTATNTPVTGPLGIDDQYTAGTSDGHTYVLYWEVAPAPRNYDLKLQVLDAAGYKTLGDDGIVVSDSIHMSTYTVVGSLTVDAQDNLYIGVTGTTDAVGHVFKMDITGHHLWNPNGVTIAPNGYSIAILPLSNGGALAAWSPSGTGLMQQYDAGGHAVWNAPKPVQSGNSKTSPAELFELSNGDFEVIFHAYSFGISSTLYAQRYNPDGVPQWAMPLRLSDRATQFITKYSAVQDGDVVYYGYFASISTRFDSYLQRINPDGVLPWGINGSDFDVNQTNFETYTHIAFTSGTSYIWAICTYTDQAQGQHGQYVQKFDKETGARQFTDNAKVLYPISQDFTDHNGNLWLVNGKPLFLIKTGFDNGATPTTLHAVLLDENGDFAWPGMSKPVGTFAASKADIFLNRPAHGQAVAIWLENKSTGKGIFAQNMTDNLLSSIQEPADLVQLKAGPNPTTTFINIEFESATDGSARLEIWNTAGQLLISSRQQIYSGQNRLRQDVRNLPAGSYSLKIGMKEQSRVCNFLIEK